MLESILVSQIKIPKYFKNPLTPEIFKYCLLPYLVDLFDKQNPVLLLVGCMKSLEDIPTKTEF